VQHAAWQWAAFLAFVGAMLALDLGVFRRKEHVVRPREAVAWSAVWIGLALAFAAVVWRAFGGDAAVEYLTGYVIEKSLSVDNIFVFVVLFGALGIPPLHQHRVLSWGILSAVVLRGLMIWGGTALLARFEAVVYVFGPFLVLTGARLLVARGVATHPEQSRIVRWLRRAIPSTSRLDGHRFLTREGGRRVATPLLLALVLIELSDVLFAVDSIPAVLAVTRDPFIGFTSNVFAMLGLRSLYFLVAGLVERFTYLRPSLAAVLIFVGVKMTVADLWPIPSAVSLAAVTCLLGGGAVASVVRARRGAPAVPDPDRVERT
jgi:tellurite resistance protein TerC